MKKKIGKFFINLFTKNIGIKLLAIGLAALTVIFINLNVAVAQEQSENATPSVGYVQVEL